MNEGYFMRNATYAMMEAAPAIPTFTPSSVSLGHWAIGGVLPDYRKVGEEMAMESVRMDNQSGNTEKHLQIIGSKAVMDSRKAKEWGLDPKALPFSVELTISRFHSISSIRIRYGLLALCLLYWCWGCLFLSFIISLYEAIERRTVEVGQRFACGERQGGRVQPTKKCFPGKHES